MTSGALLGNLGKRRRLIGIRPTTAKPHIPNATCFRPARSSETTDCRRGEPSLSIPYWISYACFLLGKLPLLVRDRIHGNDRARDTAAEVEPVGLECRQTRVGGKSQAPGNLGTQPQMAVR